MCLPDLLTFLAVKTLLGGELEYYTKGQEEGKQQLPQAGGSAQGCGLCYFYNSPHHLFPFIHKHPVHSSSSSTFSLKVAFSCPSPFLLPEVAPF